MAPIDSIGTLAEVMVLYTFLTTELEAGPMTKRRVLAHHGLGGGRVLVGVVGVGRIGVHGGHVLAQHAAGALISATASFSAASSGGAR